MCSRTAARNSNGADEDDDCNDSEEEEADAECNCRKSEVSATSAAEGSTCDGAAAAMRRDNDG